MTKEKEILDEAEIRKRIKSAEHLIAVKKAAIPRLQEKLLWVLYAQLDEGAQKKCMMIYDQLKTEKKWDSQKRDNLIALIERTLAAPAPEIKTLESPKNFV